MRIHRQCRRPRFYPWDGKIPWWRKWLLTPVFLPGKSNGQRRLVGYSQSSKESDTSERLTLSHFHLPNLGKLKKKLKTKTKEGNQIFWDQATCWGSLNRTSQDVWPDFLTQIWSWARRLLLGQGEADGETSSPERGTPSCLPPLIRSN